MIDCPKTKEQEKQSQSDKPRNAQHFKLIIGHNFGADVCFFYSETYNLRFSFL